ncbi:secreted protein [Beggiatoa sp. SS]|nr:secreted protein [Beggiatoa sp. SS]
MHKPKYLIISVLLFFLSATMAHAAGPPTEPLLRIETGMHTACNKADSC